MPTFEPIYVTDPEFAVKNGGVDTMIGKIVKVIVDRPLGSYHPDHKEIYYPVNYGYIGGIFAPDGEEQDAYIIGVNEPVKEFVGKIIAIIHRFDDAEDKWVVAPEDSSFTKRRWSYNLLW